MPHATNNMPSPGFQALILCGPGASLSTFTAKPEDFPKAIIPIANRPMLWYALDYCYRMGINDIHIVTPPESQKVITETLRTNPHLTSLPTPRPSIIAPQALLHESGTADVLRQPEVRKAITGDFIVLPCDLVSELPGEVLLEAWMTQQDDLEGASSDPVPGSSSSRGATSRKSGLGIWYPVKDAQAFKGEETDFVVTSPLPSPLVPPREGSIRGRLEHLIYAMPADTMKDIIDEQPGQEKFLPLRTGLLRPSGRVKMRTAYRDAHLYVFPHWVLDMVTNTPELDSMSEDVVGSWAKATWQPGFADKLGLKAVLEGDDAQENADKSPIRETRNMSNDIDVMNMVSTRPSNLRDDARLQAPKSPKSRPKLSVPPFLSYIHPLLPEGGPAGLLIRRVDTAAMLLSVSLRLAKLESVDEVGRSASPLAHHAKIAHPDGVAQRSTVTRADCLLDANVSIEERCVVKESVIGANCVVKAGARLTRCLLMDGVVVGERCQLTDCVVGRRAQLGMGCVLRECRVQDGNVVADATEAKGEEIMVFEGLEEDADLDDDDDDGGDGAGIELG